MKNQLLKLILTSSIVLLTASSCQEKLKSEISVKNDTLVTKVLNIDDKKDLEKNGFYAEEFFVIANKSYLRSSPDKNTNNIIDTLQFGKKVYIKSVYYDEEGGEGVVGDESLLENEKSNGFVAVYFKKPKTLQEKPNGYMTEKVLEYQYEFQKYQKYFSLPEFQKLDSNLKRVIMDNDYVNNKSFYLTESSQKAPNAICSGDFDGDGLKDVAVVLDNVENESSLVLVFLMNSSTKEPYVAYKKEFYEYLKIKKNSKNTSFTIINENDENEGETMMPTLEYVEIFGNDGYTQHVVYDKNSNKMVLK
jgi:hypothetical protein